MKAEITDASFLSAIPPKSLHFYLNAQGWEKADTWGDRGDVYVFGEQAKVLVPASSDFADYAASVGRILSIIAAVEERSELSVYRDLSVADVDLIRSGQPKQMMMAPYPSRLACCFSSRPERCSWLPHVLQLNLSVRTELGKLRKPKSI